MDLRLVMDTRRLPMMPMARAATVHLQATHPQAMVVIQATRRHHMEVDQDILHQVMAKVAIQSKAMVHRLATVHLVAAMMDMEEEEAEAMARHPVTMRMERVVPLTRMLDMALVPHACDRAPGRRCHTEARCRQRSRRPRQGHPLSVTKEPRGTTGQLG